MKYTRRIKARLRREARQVKAITIMTIGTWLLVYSIIRSLI